MPSSDSQISCPICRHQQPASAVDCENCGVAFVYREPEPLEQAPPEPRSPAGSEYQSTGPDILTHRWNTGCLGPRFNLAVLPFRAILLVGFLFVCFQMVNLTEMTGDLMSIEPVHIDKRPKERTTHRVLKVDGRPVTDAPRHPVPEPADLVFELPPDAIELSPDPDGYQDLAVDRSYVVPFRCVIEAPGNSDVLASGQVPLGPVDLVRNPSSFFGSTLKLEPLAARVAHRDLGAWVWPHNLEEVDRPIGWSRRDVRRARHRDLSEEIEDEEFRRARIREYLLEGYLLVRLPIERHREMRARFKKTAFYLGSVYWLYTTPQLPDEGPLLQIGTDLREGEQFYSIDLEWDAPCARREHKSVMQQYLGR